MTRVLFDYQAFEFQAFGGVSRIYAECITHLSPETQAVIGVKESNNVYLQEQGLAQDIAPLHSHQMFFSKKRFPGQRTLFHILEQLTGHRVVSNYNMAYCIRLLKQQRFDVFEPTFFDSYFLPYLKGKPFVMAVHDMIPELFHFKEDFQIRQKKLLCPLAAHIHVPSHQTKKDLVDILNIDPRKITVTSWGAPYLPQELLHQRLFDYPYLLYVGARNDEYKNFKAFVMAFRAVHQKHRDIRLICTGHPFQLDEQRLIDLLGLHDAVVHFFPSYQQFAPLYHHAIAFVYPSLYEGFGLPILEAFSCGCPVMLNDTGCFREVAGDAAMFFTLNNKENTFVDCFETLYNLSTADREQLIQRGYQRNQCYSWEHTAQLWEGIFKQVSNR